MAGRAFTLLLAGSAAAHAAADLPVFTESAVARGVEYVVTDGIFGGTGQYGCGVALVDLDNDGDQDIVATGASSAQIALFANDGTGHFINRTAQSGLPALSKVSGVAAGDYDGDGDLDLFFTRWLQPAVLYRNEGGLLFVNATAVAMLTGISGAGAGPSFGDFDGDGDLDLAVAVRTGTLQNQMRNRFFRNNGNGTFTDIAAALGVDDGGASFHCMLQDLDRDGDCDLYVSNDKGTPLLPNRYFRNTGGAFVSEDSNGAGIAIDSMGVCAGDLDMNGHVDIYCTNTPRGHAYLSSGDGRTYERREGEAGILGSATGWGALVFDADNDADEDLFACSMAGAPEYLWLNESGFPLAERAAECGIGDAEDSYCLASGDIDGDGDVDLLMQSRTVNLRLYANSAPAANRGLALRIVGTHKNRFAVGALVDIVVNGRTTLREVVAGSLYKSQSSMLVHAGLGAETFADRVTVRWPRVGGIREVRELVNVPAGFAVPVYPPSLIGDRDADGRVDPADLAACDACVGADFTAGCAAFDANGDCRVTKLDRAAILLRLVDLSRDGAVGAADITMLLDSWGRPDRDLTGDGLVDSADIAFMLAAW
ncbi:MAG: hypothetical protein RL325_509 [Planctomycetota bacterium]